MSNGPDTQSPSMLPRRIRVAQALFFLNAAIWVLFGIASVLRLSAATSANALTAVVVAVLMFGNAAAMLWSGVTIARRQKRFYALALAVLLINIVLTFTDQFGLFDLLTLLLDVALLGILLAGARTA